MALSENIKARRTQLKMSQEYVADQLSIGRSSCFKMEGRNQVNRHLKTYRNWLLSLK